MGDQPQFNPDSIRGEDRAVHKTPAPLLRPVVAFTFGIAVAESLGGDAWSSLILLIPIAVFVALPFVPVRTITVLVLVGAFFVGVGRHQASVRLADDHIARYLEDAPVLTRISGLIITTPVHRPALKRNPFLAREPKPRIQFLIEATELLTTDPPTPVSGFVRVSVEADSLPAGMGDLVTISGWVYRPSTRRNPGGIDWAATQRLEGIYAGMKSPGPRHVTPVERSRPSFWHSSRDRLRAFSRSLLFEPYANVEADDARGLLEAIVLGQRSAVSRELNEAFVRTGAMHFLAVSGFHVGVLAFSAWWFTRRILRRGEFGAGLTTIVVLLIYLLLVEHNAPVLRATIMGALACLARMRGRPLGVFNWLALSAACLLIYNPLELFRPGFQLSFLLITALLTIVPRAYALLMRRSWELGPPPEPENIPRLMAHTIRKFAVATAVVNLCAWTIALPLVAFHFGRFAPYGAIQSFLLTPIVVGVIVCGFVAIVLAPWLGPLGLLFDAALRFFTDLLLGAVDLLSQLPGAIVASSPRPAWIVVSLYALVALLYGLRTAHHPQRTAGRQPASHRIHQSMCVIAAAALVLIAGIWLWYPHRPAERRGFELHVLAVGNGSAAILTTPDRHALLFDAGTMDNWELGRSVARGLRAMRTRTLDLICISHANFDHYSGVPSLLESYSAGMLLVNPYFPRERERHASVRLWYQLLPADAPPISVTQAGRRLELPPGLRDEGLSIEVLWPPDGLSGWRPNDRSLVLRLTIAGRTILLPGDIERAAMSALLESAAVGRLSLQSDVLIAPHHGGIVGPTTAEFYAAVAPQTVVISSGRDRTKLAALVRRTLGPSCRVINTREVGAVAVRIAPDGMLTVDTPYATQRPILP